ncbi:hypothetical protein [Desulforamulus hydrothermalis]|nr:hypothetical protein [Desulforamulus hydrothermalis]
MRKIVILMLIIIATSSLAFGAEKSLEPQSINKKHKLTRQEIKSQLLAQQELIKNNRLQEQQLKKELAQKNYEVKQQIKLLLRKNHTLTPEKLTLIKDTIIKVKSDLRDLKNTAGNITPILAEYKGHIKNRDLAAAATNLDSIISIQQQRIALLKSLIISLEDLQKCLLVTT